MYFIFFSLSGEKGVKKSGIHIALEEKKGHTFAFSCRRNRNGPRRMSRAVFPRLQIFKTDPTPSIL
jgi:hypothetical protein